MPAQEFELCAETLQACRAAVEGGANRIELCSALNDGGLTPSHGFMQAAIATSSIPVHVLLRPRPGDFVYSHEDFNVLCADLDDALALGAAGVVVGILTPEHEVDRDRTATLVRLAAGRAVTFHRAFDRTANLTDALTAVIDLGCSRLLTSGGKPTALQGTATLRSLTQQAAGQLRIAAGGSVNLSSAAVLGTIPGLDFHASLSKPTLAPTALSDPLWRDGVQHGTIMSEDVLSLRTALGLL